MSALLFLLRNEGVAHDPVSQSHLNMYPLPLEIKRINQSVLQSNDDALTFVKCALIDSDTDFLKLQEIWQLYVDYNTTQAPRYNKEPSPSLITIDSLRTLLKTMFRTYKVSSEGTGDKICFSCVSRESRFPSSGFEDGLQCKIQTEAARTNNRVQEACHALADLYQVQSVDELVDDPMEGQSSHSWQHRQQTSVIPPNQSPLMLQYTAAESFATSTEDSESHLDSDLDSASSCTIDERDEDYPFNLAPSAPRWAKKYIRKQQSQG